MGTQSVDFVLGGARSGKTRHALRLAEQSCLTPVYVATGTPFDDEMRDRIDRHRLERGAGWTTIEEPLDLTAAIADAAAPTHVLLIDCLTLWLNNLTYSGRDVAEATSGLLRQLAASAGPVILVSNELGLGLVPDNAPARRFRDDQGRLNQAVAEIATRVTFVAAGLPLILKDMTS